jgi:hypothetical protein
MGVESEHTLRPAVAPTTHMFVQPLSFFERALAPDNMLIISFMDAGLSKVLNMTTYSLTKRHTTPVFIFLTHPVHLTNSFFEVQSCPFVHIVGLGGPW